MINHLFWIGLACYGGLFLLRLLFSYFYYEARQPKEISGLARDSQQPKWNEHLYTVLQPIVSGDPRLEEDLTANLKNTESLRFLWLLDKGDSLAEETCRKILTNPQYAARVTMLFYDAVPQSYNPKIYKVEQAMKEVETPYIIALDDDSVIDMEKMGELTQYESSDREVIVTGIPHNYGMNNFWSKLVSAFVNGNALITYFTMAFLGKNESINGMFYIVSSEIVRKYELFTAIKYYLCDDLAVAEHLMDQGVQIIQSRISVNVRNTVHTGKQYFRLMKRWLLFSSIYVKRHLSMAMFLLIIVSGSLPFLLFVLALFGGWKNIMALGLVLLFKALVLYGYRQIVIGKKQSPAVLLYEGLSDFILFPLFLITILGKPVILWRNKTIYVRDGRIEYK